MQEGPQRPPRGPRAPHFHEMFPAQSGRARARSARASAQATIAGSCQFAATYAPASLALVVALPSVAVLEVFDLRRVILLLLRWLRPFLQFQCLKFLTFTRFPFHDSQVSCWRFFGSNSASRAPKSDSKFVFSVPRASKSAPRRFQEAF